MPYALVRGARNTVRIPRPVRRWRGMGQCYGDNSVDSSTGLTCPVAGAGDSLSDLSSGVAQLNAGILTGPNATSPLSTYGSVALPPASPTFQAGDIAQIGGPGTCAPGYVVGDTSGNCVPAAQLASTLATPAGASSLGLTNAQAAAITQALAAVGTAVRVATGQPVVPTSALVASSSNPFASISPTVWIAGAGLLALVLVLKKR